MKRVLLEQNEDTFNGVLTDLQQYKPVLNLVKQTYEKLEIGSFDNSVLKEITQKGVPAIDKKYFEKCEDDFAKLNISNLTIKENILKGVNDLFNEFLSAAEKLRKFRPETYSRNQGLKPTEISFENGVYFISDEDKESIYENGCRIYAETQDELNLIKSLEQLQLSFETVLKNLNTLEFQMFDYTRNMQFIENTFYKVNSRNGKREISNIAIKQISLFRKIKQSI